MYYKDRDIEINLHSLQRRIAKGEEAALSSLYEIFCKRLHAFAFSISHSNDIASDVVEEVFVNIWVNRGNIEKIENLAVYLYVSVKNRSLNKVVDKARKLIAEPFDTIEPAIAGLAEDPYTILVTTEMMDRMKKAVEELPPRCKMIFKLVREDGLRYKEVAEILNISVNTIDVQMAIAVKRLCLALGIALKPSKQGVAAFIKKSAPHS